MFVVEKNLTRSLYLNEKHTSVTDSKKVVSELESSINADIQLKSRTFTLTDDGDYCKIQLDNDCVNDITVYGPPQFDTEDPYCPTTLKGTCHLFFPAPVSLTDPSEAPNEKLAREFFVKLDVQDNCAIIFHEYDNGQMLLSTPSPIVEYEEDQQYLGNKMLHYFLETEKSTTEKCRFYCQSRTSLQVQSYSSVQNVTKNGYWKITIDGVSYAIKNYVETNEARIWYTYDQISTIGTPYVLFDRTNNLWIFAKDNISKLQYVYKNASARQLYLADDRTWLFWYK